MAAPVSSPQPKPLRLAVVDDHPIIRSVFKTLTEDAPDMTVAWMAASLCEARDRLGWDTPDLLVIDVGLPDGNGFDLVAEVLRSAPDLPVLMVSAREDCDYPQRAVACGAKGFIAKDVSLEELVKAVNALRRGESWFMCTRG